MKHQEIMSPIQVSRNLKNTLRMKKSIYGFFFFLLLVTTSCITPQYVTNITKHNNLENTTEKTATVVGLERVFVHDYKKTLYKNFENELDFSHKFSEAFANSLVENSVFIKTKVDYSSDWNHINTMTSKKSYLKINTLLANCKTDYLIFIDELEIHQKIEHNASYNNQNPGMTNTTTEWIVLKGTVKIFDVKSHNPIIEFNVFSEDKIFLFSYSKSMFDARAKFIENAITFLKTIE